jgi:lipid A disaccharide synthetase
MADKLKIMIVAGEASGDTHAAKLVRELRTEWRIRRLWMCWTENARSRGGTDRGG